MQNFLINFSNLVLSFVKVFSIKIGQERLLSRVLCDFRCGKTWDGSRRMMG